MLLTKKKMDICLMIHVIKILYVGIDVIVYMIQKIPCTGNCLSRVPIIKKILTNNNYVTLVIVIIFKKISVVLVGWIQW